jgi:predicted regulator of Ras-like GTPase activity (Roadblock/LC7/MglB family)
LVEDLFSASQTQSESKAPMKQQIILFEEEAQELKQLCLILQSQTYAKAVFVSDRDGQMLYAQEQSGVDLNAMGSLVSGMVATAVGVSKLFSDGQLSWQSIQGEPYAFFCQLIESSLILIVVFDERSSNGLIRSAFRKIEDKFINLLQKMKNTSQNKKTMVFSEISDEDIDELFGKEE